MTKAIVRVENVSKRYRIGARREAYSTLRDTITDVMRAPFRRNGVSAAETLWALKDVSFEVAAGEILGVIGRNGAGKSTVLKILSRITEPTTGRAELFGRVGSLLEVGTGFHPELTGRENIFLNGAVLGMSRTEITERFDEIVAFSGLDKFLETPVKHYSSGMYTRLAFAVAAHLEPRSCSSMKSWPLETLTFNRSVWERWVRLRVKVERFFLLVTTSPRYRVCATA